MIKKTEAIFLRRQEIRETSLMVTAFSRDLGKFKGLVKGVRGARSAVPWYLEPLTLQSVVLYERRRSPWMLVSSFDLLDPFDPIRRDFAKTAYAAYCLELVEAMTEVGDHHPEIFHLLFSTLKALEEAGQPRSAVRFFEVHLLRDCGLLPPVEGLRLSPEGKEALRRILQTLPGAAGNLLLSGPVEEELRHLLQSLSRRAMERELRSRNFLLAMGLEGSLKSDRLPAGRAAS